MLVDTVLNPSRWGMACSSDQLVPSGRSPPARSGPGLVGIGRATISSSTSHLDLKLQHLYPRLTQATPVATPTCHYSHPVIREALRQASSTPGPFRPSLFPSTRLPPLPAMEAARFSSRLARSTLASHFSGRQSQRCVGLSSAARCMSSVAGLKKLLHISEEVADAVATNKPVVALESTIYTHGALGNELAARGNCTE